MSSSHIVSDLFSCISSSRLTVTSLGLSLSAFAFADRACSELHTLSLRDWPMPADNIIAGVRLDFWLSPLVVKSALSGPLHIRQSAEFRASDALTGSSKSVPGAIARCQNSQPQKQMSVESLH